MILHAFVSHVLKKASSVLLLEKNNFKGGINSKSCGLLGVGVEVLYCVLSRLQTKGIWDSSAGNIFEIGALCDHLWLIFRRILHRCIRGGLRACFSRNV